MGVEDNTFQITDLNDNTSFFEWATKTNSEIIQKLNLLRVYDGISGDGINVVVGVTSDGVGSDNTGVSSGDLFVELSGNVSKGMTFNDVTINGLLNYDFTKSFTGVNTVSSSVTGASADYVNGQVVRFVVEGDYRGLTLAKADSPSGAEVFGIVNGETGDNTISVATHGIVNIPSGGLEPGCVHFLDPSTAGGLTKTEPNVLGQVSKPILIATSETQGVLYNFRGQLLQGTGGTGAAQGDNNSFFLTGMASGFVRGKAISFNDGQFEITNGNNSNSMNNCVGIITEDSTTGLASGVIKVVTNGFVVNSPVTTGSGPLFVNTDGTLQFTNPGGGSKIVGINVLVGSDFAVVVHPKHDVGSFNPLTGESSGNPIQFSTLVPPTLFGATSNTGGVSYVNDNELINGSYTIWQRGIGVGSAHTGTGSTYFADRWVRLNGVTQGSGTFSILRKDFSPTQVEVEGNPLYYTRLNHSITGYTGGDFLHVENRVEGSDAFRGENMTLSFYARAGTSGATCTAFVKQVYNETEETLTNLGTFSLGTDFTKYITSFSMPAMTQIPNFNGADYVGVGFDILRVPGQLDLAQVKLERGLASTPVRPKTIEAEYEDCARYYQRSYAPDVATATNTTLSGVPDSTSLNFTVISPDSDFYYRFPVRMRSEPTVTLFSPSDGFTADAFNRTANANLQRTSGSRGLGGVTRVAQAGARTIRTGQKTKDGLLIEPLAGFVNFDNVSVHYVADADLNNDVS